MYLGPVYGSEEIAKQMPKERKEFAVADSKYRRIMVATEKTPDMLTICGMDGLLEDLLDANQVRRAPKLILFWSWSSKFTQQIRPCIVTGRCEVFEGGAVLCACRRSRRSRSR